MGTRPCRANSIAFLKFWNPDKLGKLFEAVRTQRFGQHPLLTPARVEKAAAALSDPQVRQLLQRTRDQVKDGDDLSGYARSTLMHSLALRLRRLAAHVGQAGRPWLLAHVRLPLQFGADAQDIITSGEAGSGGDGTIRTVIETWPSLQALWADGFLNLSQRRGRRGR